MSVLLGANSIQGVDRSVRATLSPLPSQWLRRCQLRDQCTASRQGRMLRWYEGEELKEMMAAVLSHPAARAKYRRRQAIVEPCFAELRERQGLKRFHRRGLPMVRAEFALHRIAFNLKKAGRGLWFVLILCWLRFPKRSWSLLGAVCTCSPTN
ncbi:MAG: transposase [Candidatus Binataceae bacterium]